MHNIKRVLLTITFIICGGFTNAQNISGAKWEFAVEQKNADEATLVLTANITEKFHIYSQHLTTTEGPLPTVFEFEQAPNFELLGKVEEGKAEEIMDEAFQLKLQVFEHTAVFKQKIKIRSKENFTLKGKLSFMACDNRMCLPPEDVPFTFNINSK